MRENSENAQHWIVPASEAWGARPESSLKFNSLQVKNADWVKQWAAAPALLSFLFKSTFLMIKTKQQQKKQRNNREVLSPKEDTQNLLLLLNQASPMQEEITTGLLRALLECTACLEFLQLPCFVYIKYNWGQSSARLGMLCSHLY